VASFTKRSVLFLAVELREARTTTGLYQDQTGRMLPIEPSIEFEVDQTEREYNRKSLTSIGHLNGMRKGRARFGLELTGGVNIPCQISNAMRCCSFADDVLQRFTIGAVTGGPFRHGERVNQASSGAYGLVVSDTWNGETVLWVTQQYQLGDGTFDASGAIVGVSSGASATPSAYVVDGGRGWWPYSFRTSRILFNATGLTSAVSVGQQIRGVTSRAVATIVIAKSPSADTEVIVQREIGHFTGAEVIENLTTGDPDIGTTAALGFEFALRVPTAAIGLIYEGVRDEIEWARGNVSFHGEVGKPVLLDFEFLGKERAVVDQGQNVYGNTSGIAAPPVLLGAETLIGLADATPAQMRPSCIRSFKVEMSHELAIRECMAAHGILDGPSAYGVAMGMVVGRKPTITIEQELGPEALIPWVESFMSNTPLRMKLTVGSEPANRFTISMPSMVPSQIGSGDYSGIATRILTLELTGGNAPGPRGDNEIVIVQDFS
jgi:hypothetical protein